LLLLILAEDTLQNYDVRFALVAVIVDAAMV
jgi:hypothetical protein